MAEYKRIDETIYSDFGKKLLNDRGSNEQINFLQSCRNGKVDFLNYLNKNLLNEYDTTFQGKSVYFDYRFTEAEFRFPPMDTQQVIWDAFHEIPRENMTFCGFWGGVIISMIKHDCIKPEYLASNLNGVNETGVYMLDRAINSNDSKTIDDCVRRVLRSMGNSAPRGKRIVFNDFYLGKAYWRWNWADKMSSEISLSFEDILKIFDETSYADFSAKMHSGKSYISQTNTLGGLLLLLKENNLKGKLKKVIDTISYLSIWKAIEIQSPELNKKEIEIIANNL